MPRIEQGLELDKSAAAADRAGSDVMIDRVVAVETLVCTMPKRRDWTQHGMAKTLEHRVILRLVTRDGVEGWGEATALPQWGGIEGRYYGETAATVGHLVHDLFAAALFECDPRAPRAVMETLDSLIVGHPYAKAAVEMALQDIRGKRCGEPLFRLLGGPYRSGIRIGHMLGIMEAEEALQEAARSIESDGITAFQIKGGTDPDRDVALIARLRAAVPESIFLRLDANKGYGRIPKQLAAIVRRLEAAGVNAIEQPASTVEGLRACREAVTVPIIADEACWTARDVLDLRDARAIDAVSVYVAKAGGMERAADAARMAALAGFQCDINGSLETGIGNAASMHVALAAETLTLPSIIPVPSRADQLLTQFAGRYWEDDLLDGGFSFREGCLCISDSPGLGIKVDRRKVDKFTVGKPRISQP
jgi:L-alanine-DL-glutamate epimerase-like enolase superfamily enzyme